MYLKLDVCTQNPRIFIPEPRPKNIYTLTQNPKPKNFLGTNVCLKYNLFVD